MFNLISSARKNERRRQAKKDLDDYITKIIKHKGNITSNHTLTTRY
jgi:hypothetical protein